MQHLERIIGDADQWHAAQWHIHPRRIARASLSLRFSLLLLARILCSSASFCICLPFCKVSLFPVTWPRSMVPFPWCEGLVRWGKCIRGGLPLWARWRWCREPSLRTTTALEFDSLGFERMKKEKNPRWVFCRACCFLCCRLRFASFISRMPCCRTNSLSNNVPRSLVTHPWIVDALCL